MTDLSIRPVQTEHELQAFLRFPWTVYKDDPNWTPPLWKEHVHFFDPEHNVELRHIDMEKFVAWRGTEPVGTILAFINHAFNDFQEVNVGWFGQFEVLNDESVAHALFKTAEDWVRDRDADGIMGPATFSTNSEIGLLIDGHEYPQMILTTHHPRYYQAFVENYGFEKAMDLWSWSFDTANWGGKKADNLPPKLTRVVKKLKDRRNITVRPINMRDYDNEAEHVKRIYNSAWERNWGFIPFNDAEIEQMKNELREIIDPDITLFVEVDGETVAFGAPLPDVYQPLRLAKCKPGEPEWLQLLRLIWHWKIRRQLDRVRVYALGVLPDYRASGVDAVMYYEMLQHGLKKGYRHVEMSWILENNDMMNRGIKMFGAEVYKTHRVYEKSFNNG